MIWIDQPPPQKICRMNKKLLILGNGFDLDLGLNTRYSDFFKSDRFAEISSPMSELWSALKASVASNLWLDMEAELFKYATKPTSGLSRVRRPYTIDQDKKFYDRLKEALTLYILEESSKESKTESCAYEIIQIATRAGFYIYNFNYTNPLRMIRRNLDIYSKRLCYVHGCAKDNTIILGCPDAPNIYDCHEYIVKSYSPYFKSNDLSTDLENATDIIFFGLSMGEVDNIYFEDLFKNGTNEKFASGKKRRVRIITYDDNSRISILNNIKRMNGVRADKLFQKWDFDIIKTYEGTESQKFQELTKRLQQIIDSSSSVLAISPW